MADYTEDALKDLGYRLDELEGACENNCSRLNEFQERMSFQLPRIKLNIKELENKYDVIDPRYLAMGSELSQTNKFMVQRLIEIQKEFHDRISKVAEDVWEIKKELKDER
jgi:archaellum component FlaC